MILNTKIIKLDINKKLYETISAKQGDTESRFLLFHIFDSSLPFDLTGKSVRVYGIKPDDKKIFNDLAINDAKKGYCTLELTNQMLSVAGLVKLELVIYNGNKKLSSIPFVLNVISSLNSEDAVVSTNEFTALMNGLAALSEYDTYKSNAKQVPVIKEEVSNLSAQLDNKAKQVDLEVERKRIDTFTKLPEGSTTGDAELIDGRVGVDGIIYDNIGGAIRYQVGTIKNDINEISENLDIRKNYLLSSDFTQGKYWNYVQNTIIQSNNSGMLIAKLEKIPAGTYYIGKCKGFFTFIEGIGSNIISKLTQTDLYFQGELVITELSNIYITIDTNEETYFTNYKVLEIPKTKGINYIGLNNKITSANTDFLNSSVNLLDNKLIQVGKYFNSSGGMGNNEGYCCIEIPVLKGNSYSSSIIQTPFTYYKTYNGTITKVIENGKTLDNIVNFIPDEDGFLLLTTSTMYKDDFMLVNDKKIPDRSLNYNSIYNIKLYNEDVITSSIHYDEKEKLYYKINTIIVAKDGTGDFNDLVDAYNSIKFNSTTNRHKIIIKPGIYDFSGKFNCQSASGSVGIILNNHYVYFEGEDPNTTILYFDGCPEGVEQISNSDAFKVSLIHWGANNPFKGYIKNLTLRAKNCRYPIHPETAGKGNGGDWLVENCIIDFLGNPNVVSWAGASVGIGISCGEKGHFKRCKWTNYNGNVEGVVGHNNPFTYEDKPAVIPNCELIFENCDFGNTIIHIDNIYNESGFYDILRLIGCSNIARGYFGHQKEQAENVWRCIKEATKITIDEFDY